MTQCLLCWCLQRLILHRVMASLTQVSYKHGLFVIIRYHVNRLLTSVRPQEVLHQCRVVQMWSGVFQIHHHPMWSLYFLMEKEQIKLLDFLVVGLSIILVLVEAFILRLKIFPVHQNKLDYLQTRSSDQQRQGGQCFGVVRAIAPTTKLSITHGGMATMVPSFPSNTGTSQKLKPPSNLLLSVLPKTVTPESAMTWETTSTGAATPMSPSKIVIQIASNPLVSWRDNNLLIIFSSQLCTRD